MSTRALVPRVRTVASPGTRAEPSVHVDPTPTYHRRVGFLCGDRGRGWVVLCRVIRGCVIINVCRQKIRES